MNTSTQFPTIPSPEPVDAGASGLNSGISSGNISHNSAPHENRPDSGKSKWCRIKSIHFLLLSVTLLLLAFPAGAFSPLLDGTMRPYSFADSDTAVPWTSDFQPVMVNYVARHGARFISSDKKVDHLKKFLEQAQRENRITEKGLSFLKLIEKVEAATSGQWGALNAIGIYEEQRLAMQMSDICPTLLEKGSVTAIATYVPRVVMSMYEFCHTLSRYSDHLEITAAEGRQFDGILRFFDSNGEYRRYIDDGPWKPAYENFYDTHTPVAPVAAMTHSVIDEHQLRKLTLDAYAILQALPAMGVDADSGEWFSEDDYRACWEVTNLKHYYQRTASTFSPLPMQSARPLLDDVVKGIDASFSGESHPVASLRFGHAETVIPLFGLMQLPGCYAPGCMPEEVATQWNDSKIAPLGANLMIVSLKGNDGGQYVALRLNGKWLEIDGRKVVSWPALRQIWTR